MAGAAGLRAATEAEAVVGRRAVVAYRTAGTVAGRSDTDGSGTAAGRSGAPAARSPARGWVRDVRRWRGRGRAGRQWGHRRGGLPGAQLVADLAQAAAELRQGVGEAGQRIRSGRCHTSIPTARPPRRMRTNTHLPLPVFAYATGAVLHTDCLRSQLGSSRPSHSCRLRAGLDSPVRNHASRSCARAVSFDQAADAISAAVVRTSRARPRVDDRADAACRR